MKKIAFGAFAVCAASVTSFANDGEEWLTLDQEIETLASSLSQGGGQGVAVSGFVRSSYLNTSDVQEPVSGNDISGFSMDNIRVMFDGSIGTTSVHVAIEGSDDPGFGAFGVYGDAGGVSIWEAYADFRITDQISGRAGNFVTPFSHDGYRVQDELLFIDRTIIGDTFQFADTGVMVQGAYDMLGFTLSVQNGSDSVGDELKWAATVLFNALGDGVGAYEGAYGADDGSALTFQLGYMDDAAITDGSAFALDGDYTVGALYVGASVVGLGDGMALGTPGIGFLDNAGGTPWDLTASYMIAEDSWEIAGRFENLDDTDSSTVITLGVNKYMEGHDAKWQIQYSTIASDDPGLEINVIQAGLTASV